MKHYTHIYYYLNVFYLVFDLYPCIHTQLDLCYSSAHEISTPQYLFIIIDRAPNAAVIISPQYDSLIDLTKNVHIFNYKYTFSITIMLFIIGC